MKTPDWTTRENFEETTLSAPYDCSGCGQGMSTGATALVMERALKPGRKKKTVVKVHNEECWATWNHNYWTAKADRRDDLVRGSGKPHEQRLAAAGYPIKGGLIKW